MAPTSMYERLGGMAFFEGLTERFYDRVAQDEVPAPSLPRRPRGASPPPVLVPGSVLGRTAPL